MTLGELGEDKIVERVLARLPRTARVEVGPGDDCAVVRFGAETQVLKTDCVIENIHFLRSTGPFRVGWKALCRVISDFGAMGATPLDALVTLAAPRNTEVSWLDGFYEGLLAAADRYDVSLVGGETARSPGPIFVSIAMSGFPPEQGVALRSGGRAGDSLFVTGKLGGSIAGHHLDFEPRLREGQWLVQHFPIHAMLDLSDGLAADLPRLARASKVGFSVDAQRLPINKGCSYEQAIGDGEDYELLFAVPSQVASELAKAWPTAFPAVPLAEIGELTADTSTRLPEQGFDHFAPETKAN
jgi:thiamine-monophosphate kinase